MKTQDDNSRVLTGLEAEFDICLDQDHSASAQGMATSSRDTNLPSAQSPDKPTIRFIDLFCGIGGFRIAAEQACFKRGLNQNFVFSCDIDPAAIAAYRSNFGDLPYGDITKINAASIPDNDIVFAGFPCQPFSICGNLQGFEDTRGTLFFEVARILAEKRPKAFVLENVKMLISHGNGKTMQTILRTLRSIGYTCSWKVLNALDFGVPQNRERVFIIGFVDSCQFIWPKPTPHRTSLNDVLEADVPNHYYASAHTQMRHRNGLTTVPKQAPTIWHANKSGHVSAYPYSCALRANASHNYLLINGERRLTEREMLRMNGFPETFKITDSYNAIRRLTGNTVAVPCVRAVIDSVLNALGHGVEGPVSDVRDVQLDLGI